MNGQRTLDDVADHVGHDALVLWGWNPGPAREVCALFSGGIGWLHSAMGRFGRALSSGIAAFQKILRSSSKPVPSHMP
jgi:hypothetical protein